MDYPPNYYASHEKGVYPPTHLCHGLEVIGVPQLYCLVESTGGEQTVLRDVCDFSHALAVTVHDRKP